MNLKRDTPHLEDAGVTLLWEMAMQEGHHTQKFLALLICCRVNVVWGGAKTLKDTQRQEEEEEEEEDSIKSYLTQPQIHSHIHLKSHLKYIHTYIYIFFCGGGYKY